MSWLIAEVSVVRVWILRPKIKCLKNKTEQNKSTFIPFPFLISVSEAVYEAHSMKALLRSVLLTSVNPDSWMRQSWTSSGGKRSGFCTFREECEIIGVHFIFRHWNKTFPKWHCTLITLRSLSLFQFNALHSKCFFTTYSLNQTSSEHLSHPAHLPALVFHNYEGKFWSLLLACPNS